MIANPSPARPAALAAEMSLLAMTDRASSVDALRALCEGAVAALPQEAAAVRMGNEKVIMKLVGRVMKESRGRADATAAAALFREMLVHSS